MNNTLEYYNNNAKSFFDETINVSMRNLYNIFQKYVFPGEKILDLGCGSGRDTKYFTEQGYNVEAIDGSKQLCELASKYTGQKIHHMQFEELDTEDEYNGIWACASLLHIQEDILPEILMRIYKALKINGYLYVSFKYGDFSGERNGRYFLDFTEKSFESVIKKINGFKIIETSVTNDARKDRDEEKWLNVIIKKIF